MFSAVHIEPDERVKGSAIISRSATIRVTPPQLVIGLLTGLCEAVVGSEPGLHAIEIPIAYYEYQILCPQ